MAHVIFYQELGVPYSKMHRKFLVQCFLLCVNNRKDPNASMNQHQYRYQQEPYMHESHQSPFMHQHQQDLYMLLFPCLRKG